MLRAKFWLILVLCFLGVSSAMANIAIDEDFDNGVAFGDNTADDPSTQPGTVQGVNIYVDPLIRDGVAWGGAGAPITYTPDPSAGFVATIDATNRCFELYAGKTLQFGSMDGTNFVNGNIPVWGDGNAIVQAALAVDTTALSAANDAVVGKLEISYDSADLLLVPPSLKMQTYELRKDTANSQVDVYSIDKNAAVVKVFDGLDGTNWAALSTVLFVRGLAAGTAPLNSQWNTNVTGVQKGPDPGTIMSTVNAGDSARVSIFANSNTPGASAGWDASNVDGRPDTLGHNNGRIMGIKFTAGAANSLYIDNIFCSTEYSAELVDDPATPAVNELDLRINVHHRMNSFTAPAQGVPSTVPPGAGAKDWEMY